MNEARHLSVVQTAEEHDEESRLAVRLCEAIWGAAYPRSRVMLKQSDIAEQLQCSARWIGTLTDRMESRLLVRTERAGAAGLLFKLLVTEEDAIEAMLVTSVTTSDRTSDRPRNRSDRSSGDFRSQGPLRARDTLPAPPPAPPIGSPDTSDRSSDRSDRTSDRGSGNEHLTPDGWLAYLGMGHAPGHVAARFEALSEEQREYCIAEVVNADPPTTNWRFLAKVITSAEAREDGIALQRRGGLEPAIAWGSGNVTQNAALVEMAVAAAVAAVHAMRESEHEQPIPRESTGGTPVQANKVSESKDMRTAVGGRLRAARGARPQRSIAERAGITQASLSNYENGKREVPTSTLLLLAVALGRRAVDLLPELAR